MNELANVNCKLNMNYRVDLRIKSINLSNERMGSRASSQLTLIDSLSSGFNKVRK